MTRTEETPEFGRLEPRAAVFLDEGLRQVSYQERMKAVNHAARSGVLTISEWVEEFKDSPLSPEVVIPVEPARPPRYISQAVRREVFERDGGACVDCGARELLEFDHVIPVSKGGSSSASNIQLLCQACNRAKSNKI